MSSAMVLRIKLISLVSYACGAGTEESLEVSSKGTCGTIGKEPSSSSLLQMGRNITNGGDGPQKMTTSSLIEQHTAKVGDRCMWSRVITGSIAGYNLAHPGTGYTMESCQAECSANIECRSVDFHPADGTCVLGSVQINDLNDDSTWEHGYDNDNHPDWQYSACYGRCDRGSWFAPWQKGSIAGHNLEYMGTVKSSEVCMSACDANPDCKSIDFHNRKTLAFAHADGECVLGNCKIGNGPNDCQNDNDADWNYRTCVTIEDAVAEFDESPGDASNPTCESWCKSVSPLAEHPRLCAIPACSACDICHECACKGDFGSGWKGDHCTDKGHDTEWCFVFEAIGCPDAVRTSAGALWSEEPCRSL